MKPPKYSHIERERRWLVDRSDIPKIPVEFTVIRDRYITGTRVRLRRMEETATAVVSLKLTKKYEATDPRYRPIVTIYLNDQEFCLFDELPGNEIVKRRYKVEVSDTKYILDVFENKLDGLVIAEIECGSDSELTEIAAPHWSKREITNDARFQGGELSKINATQLLKLLQS